MSRLKDYINDLCTVNEECISVAREYRILLINEQKKRFEEVKELKEELEKKNKEISEKETLIRINKYAAELKKSLNDIKNEVSTKINSSSESQESAVRSIQESLSQLDAYLKGVLEGISKGVNESDSKIDEVRNTVKSLADEKNTFDGGKQESGSIHQDGQLKLELSDESQMDLPGVADIVTEENDDNTDTKDDLVRLEKCIEIMSKEEFYEKIFRNFSEPDELLIYILTCQTEKGVIGNATRNALKKIIGGKQ